MISSDEKLLEYVRTLRPIDNDAFKVFATYKGTSNNSIFVSQKCKNQGNSHTRDLDNRLSRGPHKNFCQEFLRVVLQDEKLIVVENDVQKF